MSQPGRIELIPLKVKLKRKKFDLFQTICESLKDNNEKIQDGDIIVISSKFVALSEGRTVNLSIIKPSKKALQIASELNMPPALAELVLREADTIFYGIPGFLLTVKEGVIIPNAGIDRSNIDHGKAILYPLDSFAAAERLRMQILFLLEKKVGVIITDSRLMPTRIGTTGITLAASGLAPVIDERGKRDLFGNIMRVTRRAVADDISAAANLLMGETDESIPIVIARNTSIRMVDRKISRKELAVHHDECIFVRGLRGSSQLLQNTHN
jgi:coenzyme F420-0:L-glutamate ligase/coenzyme F420-1:gamma-L-glutamate ligase